MIPSVWTFALLALAAFRCWKLIGDDAILDRPRDWLVKRLHPRDLRLFLTCPWCAGFWIVLAWWGAWYLWPHGTTVAAVPLALSAAVGLIAAAYLRVAD